MKPTAILLLSLLGAAVNVGCGPKRVPTGVLDRLPFESRIELLEAENDLALAVDHLEEARTEVGRQRAGLRRAKDRLSAAENEESNAKDSASKEVARLAVEEARARVEYLRARQRVEERSERIQEVSLRCARDRFELARMSIARKVKVKGSESLEPQVFEKQVKSCEEDVANLRRDLKEPTDQAKAAKDGWDSHRSTLARKTFDARASPYVE